MPFFHIKILKSCHTSILHIGNIGIFTALSVTAVLRDICIFWQSFLFWCILFKFYIFKKTYYIWRIHSFTVKRAAVKSAACSFCCFKKAIFIHLNLFSYPLTAIWTCIGKSVVKYIKTFIELYYASMRITVWICSIRRSVSS